LLKNASRLKPSVADKKMNDKRNREESKKLIVSVKKPFSVKLMHSARMLGSDNI
jgi:hypothetical protein